MSFDAPAIRVKENNTRANVSGTLLSLPVANAPFLSNQWFYRAHVAIAIRCWGGRCTMSFLLIAITTRQPHKPPSTTLKLHLHNVALVVAWHPQRNKTVVCVCLNANLPYSAAAMTCERTRAALLYSCASPTIHDFTQVIRPIARVLRLCEQIKAL